MNAVNPAVSAAIGPPMMKTITRPATMAVSVGMIIIGIRASAHFGTFR